jgi:hypothetical protein
MLRPKIAPAYPGPESRSIDAKSSDDGGKLWRTAEPRTSSGGASPASGQNKNVHHQGGGRSPKARFDDLDLLGEVRQKVVDDVGPLALGDELTRIIFRQELADVVEDFLKLPSSAEALQLLCQMVAFVLGGGEGDAADGQTRHIMYCSELSSPSFGRISQSNKFV